MLNKFYNKIVLTIIALCLVIITVYIINSGFFKKNSDWKLVSDSKNHVYIFRNEGKEVCSAYVSTSSMITGKWVNSHCE